jgi:hypothetical protein
MTTAIIEAINEYKANCNGTGEYHQYGMFRKTITDGVKLVANAASAYWLLDVVFSHQLNFKAVRAANGFQVWRITLNKKGSGCKVTMDDGGQNGGEPKVLITQRIPFTDFPKGVEVVMYLESGILMLKEER